MKLNIAGVVGVGKSSLCNILEKEGYSVFREPVFDNPLLDKFYYDKRRYAFPLQIFFLNKRFEMCKHANKIQESVLDRSILEDTIFAKMLRDRDEMDPYEYQIYKELLNNMMDHIRPPELMVYLKASPEEAIRRIKKRGRDYEVKNNIDYWHDLNQNYNNFFHEYKWSPLLIINVDTLDFVNKELDAKHILGLIQTKLILNGTTNEYIKKT
jgi:deoxyadenosine/deoxycytidine kinase